MIDNDKFKPLDPHRHINLFFDGESPYSNKTYYQYFIIKSDAGIAVFKIMNPTFDKRKVLSGDWIQIYNSKDGWTKGVRQEVIDDFSTITARKLMTESKLKYETMIGRMQA